jgi:hypothetical protein
MQSELERAVAAAAAREASLQERAQRSEQQLAAVQAAMREQQALIERVREQTSAALANAGRVVSLCPAFLNPCASVLCLGAGDRGAGQRGPRGGCSP